MSVNDIIVSATVGDPESQDIWYKWYIDGTYYPDYTYANIGDIYGATWHNPGQVGSALNFDGVADYVDCGQLSSFNIDSMTLEAWVYWDGVLNGDQDIIINKEDEYELAVFDGSYTDGNIGWAIKNADGNWAWHDTGYALPTEQWVHIALTYDGADVLLYANAVLEDTVNYNGGIVPDENTPLWIGRRSAGSHGEFDGMIDEVRILRKVLGSTEISEDYTTSSAGNTYDERDGTVAWYRFDENTGSIAYDSSSIISKEHLDPSGTKSIELAYGAFNENSNVVRLEVTNLWGIMYEYTLYFEYVPLLPIVTLNSITDSIGDIIPYYYCEPAGQTHPIIIDSDNPLSTIGEFDSYDTVVSVGGSASIWFGTQLTPLRLERSIHLPRKDNSDSIAIEFFVEDKLGNNIDEINDIELFLGNTRIYPYPNNDVTVTITPASPSSSFTITVEFDYDLLEAWGIDYDRDTPIGFWPLQIEATTASGATNTYSLVVEFDNSLPDITIVSPDTAKVRVNEMVTFSDATNEPDGDPFIKMWDFGDLPHGVGFVPTSQTFIDRPGAEWLSIHFSSFDTGADKINLYGFDGSTRILIGTYEGVETDVWTQWIQGSKVEIIAEGVATYTIDLCDEMTTVYPEVSFPDIGSYAVILTAVDCFEMYSTYTIILDVVNTPPNIDQITVNGQDYLGQISEAIDTFDFVSEWGSSYILAVSSVILKISDNIFAVAYSTFGSHEGTLHTFEITEDGNFVTLDDVTSTYVFDQACYFPEIIKISDNVIAIVYEGSGGIGKIQTIGIESNGNIYQLTEPTTTDYIFDSSCDYRLDVIHIANEVYALAYRTEIIERQGMIKTIGIESNGNIYQLTEPANTEYIFESYAWCLCPEITQISSEVFAVTYIGELREIIIKTFRIESNGNILTGAEFTNSFNIGTAAPIYKGIELIHVSNDIYSVIYSSETHTGVLSTLLISADGLKISNIDTFEFESVFCFCPTITHIADDLISFSYSSTNGDTYIKTIEISKEGLIGAVKDSQFIPTYVTYERYIRHVVDDIYVIMYNENNYGYMKTYSISNNMEVKLSANTMEMSFLTSDYNGDSIVEYAIDFGDGTKEIYAVLPTPLVHTYAEYGEYLFTITIKDSRGGTCSKQLTVITYNQCSPTISIPNTWLIVDEEDPFIDHAYNLLVTDSSTSIEISITNNWGSSVELIVDLFINGISMPTDFFESTIAAGSSLTVTYDDWMPSFGLNEIFISIHYAGSDAISKEYRCKEYIMVIGPVDKVLKLSNPLIVDTDGDGLTD
ncbi:MAG: hypothetical protein KAS32_04280, partial [Candidatus Peribacteraceae bacterium]|nr:hypothetical protein [Candidatus Peribacteraceae bacterium]